MPLRFEIAASGIGTASLSGRALHSTRDPLREARRFLDERLKVDPSGFIVLGSCLGYIESAIEERFPALPRYSIQYDEAFRGREVDSVKETWYPGSSEGLESFLLKRLDPADLDGLDILDWPPAAQAYPEQAARCLASVKNVVLTMNGSANALQAFGPACILNAARSAAFGLRFLMLKPASLSQAIVIAASGPSLEDSLPELRENRSSYFLIALSSAARALAHSDIRPDLIVSSDPGYWAGLHLSGLPWSDVPLAFPLSARVPRDILESWPLAAIKGENGFESSLAASLSLPAIALPESGTVAATALDLAIRLGRGPVAFCGLDLSSQDIRSHCRPHAFDHFTQGASYRLNPAYSMAFSREAGSEKKGRYRISPQLSTYEAYFARVAQREERVYALSSAAPGMAPFRKTALPEMVRAGASAVAQAPFLGLEPRLLPMSRTADLSRDKAIALIRGARKSCDAGAPSNAVDRAILEQVSFSSVLKLRKAGRSRDEGLKRAALAELDARLEVLAERMNRISQTVDQEKI
jgi:hypothetical protein